MTGYKTILMRGPGESVGVAVLDNTVTVMMQKGNVEEQYSETLPNHAWAMKRYNEIVLGCVADYHFHIFMEENFTV